MAYALTTVRFEGPVPSIEVIRAKVAERTGLQVTLVGPGEGANGAATLKVTEFEEPIGLHRLDDRLAVDLNDLHPYLASALMTALADLGGFPPAKMPDLSIRPWAETAKWAYSLRTTVRSLTGVVLIPVSIAFELVVFLPIAVAARTWGWMRARP